MTSFLRYWPLMAMATALFGLAFWVLDSAALPSIERVELLLFDQLQARVRPPATREKVMAVIATDKSLRELGRWPFPRVEHVRVLGQLGLARVVAVDILFPERSEDGNDALLAATVERMGNVVLAMHFSADSDHREATLAYPYPALTDAAKALGFTNIRHGIDGTFRNAMLVWPLGGEYAPSLPLAAWMEATDAAPDIKREKDGFAFTFPDFAFRTGPDAEFAIHHPVPEIPIYEYADVLRGDVDPEVFRDAVVFVGASAAGTDDFFPIGRELPLAGVLFNAHATLTLFHGWIPRAAPAWLAVAVGTAMSALGILIGTLTRLNRGWLLMWLSLAAGVALSLWLFYSRQMWLPPVLPLLFCVAAFCVAMYIQLRHVSKSLEVQRFSIESQLLLGRSDLDPQKTTFAEFLANNWTEVERRSGVRILVASADTGDSEVDFCLKRLSGEEAEGVGRGRGAEVYIIVGAWRWNRLLVCHPVWGDEAPVYTVLTWSGSRGVGQIRSTAALVVSALMHYRVAAENQAKHELFIGVIRFIMGAVDAKDPTTAGHSERVAVLARRLAERLGLPRREVDEIYLSGLLHDVGKIGIPDKILNSPGRLTDEEMEVMRRHPSLGSELMSRIKLPDAVLQGIVEHHERMDGLGYPLGKEGDVVSLAGRILKVADVFDALSSKRQYKEALKQDVVLQILNAGSGSEFDPELVRLVRAGLFSDMYENTTHAGGAVPPA